MLPLVVLGDFWDGVDIKEPSNTSVNSDWKKCSGGRKYLFPTSSSSFGRLNGVGIPE
jgi:hypothetical protein